MFVPVINSDGLAAAAERLKGELSQASREAVTATAQESQGRLQRHTYWKKQTGATAGSFRVAVLSDYASRVTSSSPIATFLNDGTKAHAIVAKRGFLRFVQNGSVRFAKQVRHPGMKALNYEAAEQREGQADLAEYGDAALRRAVERSGLG